MTKALQAHTFLGAMQPVLEVLAKLVAPAATVCFVLSVLFDWGYLSALDLRFSEVPTTLSDHTRSAILWLPVVGLLLPLAVVFSIFSAKNRGEDTSVHAAKKEKYSRRLLAVFVTITVVLWLAFGDRVRPFLFIAVFCIWALIVACATPITDGNWRWNYYIRLGLVLPPLLAGSMYSFGYNTGRAAIAPDQSVGVLIVRGSSGSEQMRGNIVRPFERFVIVLDESRKIILLKPDDIIRIERAGQLSSNKGLLCDYWQLGCPHVPVVGRASPDMAGETRPTKPQD